MEFAEKHIKLKKTQIKDLRVNFWLKLLQTNIQAERLRQLLAINSWKLKRTGLQKMTQSNFHLLSDNGIDDTLQSVFPNSKIAQNFDLSGTSVFFTIVGMEVCRTFEKN